MTDYRDISHLIDIFDMPVCPLCDNAIMSTDPVELVMAHGSLFLVHSDCLDDADNLEK